MANDIVQRLLARIRLLRETRGLSQEAFAERAGLKYKHYQAVEAGRRPNIQLPTLIKIAEGLGLRLSELVDFEAAPPILAEDAAKYGSGTAAGKGVRKPVKRRSGVKR